MNTDLIEEVRYGKRDKIFRILENSIITIFFILLLFVLVANIFY